jgi:hypothetical protein
MEVIEGLQVLQKLLLSGDHINSHDKGILLSFFHLVANISINTTDANRPYYKCEMQKHHFSLLPSLGGDV